MPFIRVQSLLRSSCTRIRHSPYTDSINTESQKWSQVSIIKTPCTLVQSSLCSSCTRIRHSPYTHSRKTTSQKTFTSEVRTPCTLSHSLTLVTSYTAFAVYVFVEKGQERNISKLCFFPGLFSSSVHGSFFDIKKRQPPTLPDSRPSSTIGR